MAKREYAKIAPTFWTGDTGQQIIDAGPTVITVALYLVTGPHAEPTGLYRIPLAYVQADLRLTAEDITAAIERLEAVGFIERDHGRQLVWVREMGAWQIEETLKRGDSRRKMVEKRLAPHRGSPLFARFIERYGEGWGLDPADPKNAPSRAPSTGGGRGRATGGSTGPRRTGGGTPRGTGRDGTKSPPVPRQEQEQEQEQQRSAPPLVSDLVPLVPASGEHATGAALRPHVARGGGGGDGDGGTPTETAPASAVERPEPPLAPSPPPDPPAASGAFLRRLARHEAAVAAKRPKDGRSLRFRADTSAPEGKGGALLFGSDPAHVAPGPWSIPPPVWDALEARLWAPVPRPTLPPPPKLPPLPDGVAPEREQDDELADAMLVAWRAVYRRKAERAYSGNVGKRKASVAEAARMLRDEGISAWVYLDFGWDNEMERTRQRPTLFGLAAPKAVGRLLWKCRRDAPTYEGIVADVDAHRALLDARQRAEADVRRERPSTAEQALAIVDRTLPQERYDDLLARTHQEVEAMRSKATYALKRGLWIWNR